MKHKSRYSIRQLGLTIVSLLWASLSFALPTIPQKVFDAINQNGTARIIVGLNILGSMSWAPEGSFRFTTYVTLQRKQIADTQTQFIETLNQDLVDNGIINNAHAEITFITIPYLVMEVNSLTLPYVQQNALTSSIALDAYDEPSLQDTISLIGADKAWEQGYSGQGQAIAIVDTGVDKTHPAFSPNRVIAEACFSQSCPNGKTKQEGENAAVPCDFNACEHGTHVAGIAAGIAKNADIIAVQVFSNFGGMAYSVHSDQLRALDWLSVNYGYYGTPLAAVNMSLGGREYVQSCDDDPRVKIIQNLHSLGIATIASAGNAGYPDGISAPACISEAISVGATDKFGNLWTESNRAETLDLLAPGVGIESALPGDLTGARNGTSMAAPHVAGTWAILKAAKPKAKPDEILAMLKDTGQQIDGIPKLQLDAIFPPPPNLNEGLVAYYPFDGNANDGSESGNHGIVHEATLTEDRFGNANSAYSFDGNDWIEIPNHTSIDIISDLTITAWISAQGGSSEGRGLIVAKGDGNDYKNAYQLRFQYDTGDKALLLSVSDRGTTASYLWNSQGTVPLGEFAYVVATIQGTTANTYVNGNKVDSGFITSNRFSDHGSLRIGGRGDNWAFFKGIIDEVRIYNRALSESEIQGLYQLGSEPESVTLTVNTIGDGEITSTDNAILCGETCQADYEVDSTVTLIATALEAFTFTHWNGDCTGTSTTTTVTMDAAKTCTANFEKLPNQYSLKVTKTGEGMGRILAKLTDKADWDIDCRPSCQQANYAYAPESKVFLRTYSNKGSIFSGWSGDCSGTNKKTTITMDAAKTCTAQFDLEPNQVMYPLTINKVGEDGVVKSTWPPGINCGTDCNAYYQPNTMVNLEAFSSEVFFEESNSLFMGWTGDCSGKNPKQRIMMDADKTCTATFQTYNPNETFPLTVNKIGNGQGNIIAKRSGEDNTIHCKTNCQQANYDYQAGSKVILNVTPAKNVTFAGWSGECSGNNKRITVLMDTAKNCNAQFDLDSDQLWHQLTVTKVGTGNGTITQGKTIHCGNLCSAYYQEGKRLGLKATPSLFSQFVGWSGDCTGTEASVKVTMTANRNCTANFQNKFETAAMNMVETFYANATLENGDAISTRYPRTAENEARLKQAFWVSIPALIQTDQHLATSAAQKWPVQFDGIEWLPTDSTMTNVPSIQIITNEFIGVGVTLNSIDGIEELVGIVIYDGEKPLIDKKIWSFARKIKIATYFSKYISFFWNFSY